MGPYISLQNLTDMNKANHKKTQYVGYSNNRHVYIIQNSSFRENIYKIGVTTDATFSCINSLFSTGVPCPYRIKYLLKFCNNEQNTVETWRWDICTT